MPRYSGHTDKTGCCIPNQAIAFRDGAVRHIYFVAETKGSMSSMALREIGKTKIKCARQFFEDMNRRYAQENVKYTAPQLPISRTEMEVLGWDSCDIIIVTGDALLKP